MLFRYMLLHHSRRFSSSAAITPPLITPKLLKQCNSVSQVNLIHQQTLVQGLITHFSTNLISTYLAISSPSHALSLLQSLTPSPSAVYFWNALIRCSIRPGLLNHSLALFRNMWRLGWTPDNYTFPLVFKACGDLMCCRLGASIHGVVFSTGFESNVFVCNAIVTMYGRCGELDYAHKLFDEMCERRVYDLVSWNSIVAVYVQRGDCKNALRLFDSMCKLGDIDMRPDVVSLVNVLPACASMGAWLHGKAVHGIAVRSGSFEDLFVGNALVDMYAKCGMVDEASKVFDRIKEKDVVSWNAMVNGYSQIGRFEDALGLFEKMREENIELNVVTWSAVIAGFAQRGLGCETLDVFREMQVCGSKPNVVTLVSLLSGCASVGALLHGKETHCYAIKCMLNFEGSDLEDDIMVINALIDMYAKCKRISMARTMFDSIEPEDKDVVSWTVMIGGYAQHGEANDALELFSWMIKQDGLVKPNCFTISCALIACARLAALRLGRQIHAYILRNHFDSAFLYVANCLLDMYAKSGDIDVARFVFDNLKQKNFVSWTSLMTGYGMHGRGEEALQVFDEMRRVGLQPDGVTLLVVLYACSHSGMIDQGIKFFNSMSKEFGVIPGQEHYACMVDLLGRAGRLNEAMELIEGMQMEPSSVVWVALLSGCRIHANVELGEHAAKQLLELNSENDGSCTLLSNIYANARRWKDVARVRSLMKNSGIRKRPGCSWVQGKKGTATFYVADKTHPQSKQIYEILRGLTQRIKVLGYVPETSFALHDVDDEEKGDLLFEHSEKLALAYGILISAPGAPIRITKNLRVCGDCHNAITYISMIIDHEIILRDSSRFHHFKKGSCSCRGYW
ncbi:PREDICTED: pentatricopeptide repeat-containing protein At5g16860 [Populus euphratica]|uniref:Pentatricopeptide repeat-containing protein At5g16860 n=1 Tax=Populus euphratica TaxID=75702 RepID=A0AAJ6SXD5_POPEU|nr:PREDICTED: pentatricopeptide repeat-containing protein At5g16860 [Populus euphratica]XP_011000738.1 PREDICTED: pentatricopeptide repeat-containing protein At5g16860 [Populus euphratica]